MSRVPIGLSVVGEAVAEGLPFPNPTEARRRGNSGLEGGKLRVKCREEWGEGVRRVRGEAVGEATRSSRRRNQAGGELGRGPGVLFLSHPQLDFVLGLLCFEVKKVRIFFYSPLPRTQPLIGRLQHAVPQVVHDQEEACQENETEQAYSSLDSSPYRQHHQHNLSSLPPISSEHIQP
ncbi:hypothetical protein YC2023_095566 [Brassica napus]